MKSLFWWSVTSAMLFQVILSFGHVRRRFVRTPYGVVVLT